MSTELDSWELTFLEEPSDSSQEIAVELGEWGPFVYDFDCVVKLDFIMESERGAVVNGKKFIFPVITEGVEDSDPLSDDDLIPELLPDNIAIKIIMVTRMELSRPNLSSQEEVVTTIAYGIQDADLADSMPRDIANVYLQADDDVATAILSEMTDAFSGLV